MTAQEGRETRVEVELGRGLSASAGSGPVRTHQSKLPVFLGTLALLAAIGLFDWAITSALSISLLYLVPVGVGTWLLGLGPGSVLAVLAAFTWYLAEVWGRSGHTADFNGIWQGLSRLGFYGLTAFLIDRVRTLTFNLEALVRTRTLALQTEVLRRKQLEQEAADISEREQERIAHELHDELAAYMAGIAFRAKTLAESLDGRGAPEAADAGNLVKLVNCATQQVRSFSRLLAPLEGAQTNLAAALSRLGNEVETVFRITCAVDIQGLPELTSEQCSQLYRIAQEAVRNAIQHAEAELVRICVQADNGCLRLSIRCDGKPWEHVGQPSTGMGLRIMRHRTERMGGQLEIQPDPAGGALVVCEVPLPERSTEGTRSLEDPARS